MVITHRRVFLRFDNSPPGHNSNVPTSNRITTAKYGYSTFLPKFLIEQFRRYSNIFFTFIALFQQIPDVSPTGPYTTAVPLLCILGVSAIKELYEDMKRHKADAKVNETEICVLNRTTLQWDLMRWQDVKVGDIVKCLSENFFPSDMLLLASSENSGMCYIETANLDGETNLKIRQSLPVTSECLTSEKLKYILNPTTIECDQPNARLYEFEGQLVMHNGDERYPLGPLNILLRGAKLKNTSWVYGLVLYTGHESKLMMNSLASTPAKQSVLEKTTNTHILWLVFILLTTSFVSAIFAMLWNSNNMPYYIADIVETPASFAMTYLTFLILYNNLVPISLQVSLEVVRTFQAHFINSDADMYDKKSKTFAMARTSNLNEELGQVKYILSDKTGTLTMNVMNFKECTIDGTVYDELTLAEAARAEVPCDYKTAIAGSSSARSKEQTHSQILDEFLTLLASCHTVVPELDKEIRRKLELNEDLLKDSFSKLKDHEDGPRNRILDASDSENEGDIHVYDNEPGIKLNNSPKSQIVYHAASPDEAALVRAAQQIGYEFANRTPRTISIKKFGILEEYEVLQVFEFDSVRKRMSVVLKKPDGNIKIYTKGADSVIQELLKDKDTFEATLKHIQRFALKGLRTLCCAYAQISKSVYEEWLEQYDRVKLLQFGKEEAVEACIAKLERNLCLLGATAIEDKLQDEVPETIDTLLKAGINFWLLTGDKQETAINIGYSSKLLSRNMPLIVINQDSYDATRQLLENAKSTSETALVIDGKSLQYAFSGDLHKEFMRVALTCRSVICCRVSPFQKATVVESVKKMTGEVTLAIGDGANDVAMIRSANIGVGISGSEGLQAAHSADYTISQFRFLSRLLLVHGAWSMSRLKKMILYSFYKNIALYIVEFWFAIVSGWSGQTIFERWTIGLYNVIFTAAPPFAIGVFDRRCSAEYMMKNPHLYHENANDKSYNFRGFWSWILTALWHSLFLFWFTYALIEHDVLWVEGRAGGYLVFGCMLYTYVVVTVCLKAGLEMSSWTILTHFAIWGSIAIWFVFLISYSYFWPTLPIAPDMVGIYKMVFGSWVFWTGLVLVPSTALIVDVVFKVLQTEKLTKKILSIIRKNGLAPFRC